MELERQEREKTKEWNRDVEARRREREREEKREEKERRLAKEQQRQADREEARALAAKERAEYRKRRTIEAERLRRALLEQRTPWEKLRSRREAFAAKRREWNDGDTAGVLGVVGIFIGACILGIGSKSGKDVGIALLISSVCIVVVGRMCSAAIDTHKLLTEWMMRQMDKERGKEEQDS